MRSHHVLFSAFLIIGLFSLGKTVHALTPVVSSFVISPASINNAYSIALSWTLNDASSADVLFSCSPGVLLKKIDGTSFPCGIRTLLSGSPLGDTMGLTVINVSGATRAVTATLYPKDSSGLSIDANAQTASFTVSTSPQPLLSIVVASSTVLSGAISTFSWVGHDISNVNVLFDCNTSLTLYAGTDITAKPLFCNQNAYASDLLATDKVTVTAVNNSPNATTLNAKVIPFVGNGSYDATHSLSISTVVGPKIEAVITSVADFRSSQSDLYSGINFNLLWSVANATGANMQFQCVNNDVSVQLVDGTSTSKIACNTLAFAVPLAITGSSTFSITNNTPYTQSIPVLLLPQVASSTYLANVAKTITLNIPIAGLTIRNINTIASSTLATSSLTLATSTTSTSTNTFVIKTNLHRGSKGKDVTLLQQFLTQNPKVYPTVSITGYYGMGTKIGVKKFQTKYAISKIGAAGYGSVGPSTRARIKMFTNIP